MYPISFLCCIGIIIPLTCNSGTGLGVIIHQQNAVVIQKCIAKQLTADDGQNNSKSDA